MDFDLSSDQKLLVDSVASFVKKESPIARARKLREDATGWQASTWKKMGDMGWLSLPFHITGFVPAFLGALIISVVTWLLSVLIPDGKRDVAR